MLSEELTISYALEHLDELRSGRSKLQSPQNDWIGILVPFQAMSSISFELFRRFQVYDSLTITAILMLLTDQDIDIQIQYTMSFMRFIIAQMTSRNGRFYLEEGFTTLPVKETKFVYDWISADTAKGQFIGCPKLESNCTLYEIWKAIEPLILRKLDCLGKLEVTSSRRNVEIYLNQKFESYADHLFNFTYIKCLCNGMINGYPSPWKTFTWVVHTDSSKIGDIFRYIQMLLHATIDATTFSRKIKQSRKIENETKCNENRPFKAAQSIYLKSLATLAQSKAGVEAVAQSILDFDFIPDLIRLTAFEEREIWYNATVILQKLFERPKIFYWFLHNDSACQIQGMLSKSQEIRKYIEFAFTCQSSRLVNELRRSWDGLLKLSGSFTTDENLINLRQLLVYLQIYLWELTLNDQRLVFI
ncbi:hypothetical protein NQZ79_g3130 [Umbelopsis isabellina]|nr:hypothetical protein NQZ79_g3130 [Umbelopsis isabellina]